MQLVSVNVSQPKTIPYGTGTLTTGIYKEAVAGRVMLGTFNLDGDGQADLKNHGGAYKAVYAYPHEHYATWAEELGRDDFAFGQFGENFTVTGMLETDVCIGDTYRIGTAMLQVTQPRVPCFKLAHKMGLPDFVKTFLRANRSGFYMRVLEEGEVGTGDTIELVQSDAQAMSVAEINHLLYFDKNNIAAAEKALLIEGMSPGWHDSFAAIVEKARAV